MLKTYTQRRGATDDYGGRRTGARARTSGGSPAPRRRPRVDDLGRRPLGLAMTPFGAFWPLNRDFSPPRRCHSAAAAAAADASLTERARSGREGGGGGGGGVGHSGRGGAGQAGGVGESGAVARDDDGEAQAEARVRPRTTAAAAANNAQSLLPIVRCRPT